MTNFVFDSENQGFPSQLDQRLFVVSGSQYKSLIELLEQPAQPNEGLRDLFSHKAPWDDKKYLQPETMALLKLLSLGRMVLHEGKFQSADDFFDEMDKEA